MRPSNDVGALVVAALEASGLDASTSDLPRSFADALPHVHAVTTGGAPASFVQEWRHLDLDVYAADYAASNEAAGRVAGVIRELGGSVASGTAVYRAVVAVPPYDNPDPRHPTVARTTVKAQLLLRV